MGADVRRGGGWTKYRQDGGSKNAKYFKKHFQNFSENQSCEILFPKNPTKNTVTVQPKNAGVPEIDDSAAFTFIPSKLDKLTLKSR